MSPLWRDVVTVFLAPDAVRVQRHRRGLRPQAEPARTVACEAGAHRTAACVQALRQALQPFAGRAFDARVVLSNHLVRYALVPDADALQGVAERGAAARHALRSTYGELADPWEVATDQSGGWDELLAAGVDADLLPALQLVLRDCGARGLRIEPLLAVATNRAGRAITGATGWLAVVEPQRIVLATLAGNSLRAVRSHRLRHAALEELPQLLDQSRLVDPADDARREVVVAGENLAVQTATHGDLQFRAVPLDFNALGAH